MTRIITLTTDFGTADGYVGAVKGAILSIHPKATLVDLTHEIPSYDIVTGAFHLATSFATFPKGTIHLAVVDPGVGTARRPLAVVTQNHLFVGPDNGLFTLVVAKDGLKAAYELTESRYWRRELSSTFHGRDLFGPVAAHLAKGMAPARLGRPLQNIQRLKDFDVLRTGTGLKGKILFFDKFGNALTNLHRNLVTAKSGVQVIWKGKKVPLYRTYSEIPSDQVGAIFGSSGYLELAVREGDFQRQCDASKCLELLLKNA